MSERTNFTSHLAIGLVATVFSCAPLTARTIYVDNDGHADFNTIQAAIDDANDGDTIIVKPGTYTGDGNRDIDFKGKAITVLSTDPNDPNIVASTTIDGQWDPNEIWLEECDPYHRGFKFHSGEEPDSVIDGLTITNFFAPDDEIVWAGGGFPGAAGGGIFCRGSSPTIRRCIIRSNRAYEGCYGTYVGLGGGIFCDEGSSPTITACTITDNDGRLGAGGIFCIGGSPIIDNCTIVDNASYGWGGVECRDCNATVAACMVSGNGGAASTATVTVCSLTV